MNNDNILLRHNFIAVPASNDQVDQSALATVMMNIAYYGYAFDAASFNAVCQLSAQGIVSWWQSIETELKDITGENRKIDKFVVYKNFPDEVLSKSDAEYWLPQMLMYWGLPSALFTEKVEPRKEMTEKKTYKVLRLANDKTLGNIFDSLLRAPARWKDTEYNDVLFLSQTNPVVVGNISFKENLVRLASHYVANHIPMKVSTGTDVLRLAAGLSDGDISLREKFKFKSFKKPVRRYLLNLLEGCGNLDEDMARRPELWKRLVHLLHPGDYKKSYPKVIKAMNGLYKDELETFNSQVEALLKSRDDKALDVLSTRPGDFRRRLAHVLSLYGAKATEAFTSDKVLDKLTNNQLVVLRSHLETVNGRLYRMFPPKGNWNKVKVEKNEKPIDMAQAEKISNALTKKLASRLPTVKVLDEETKRIKLPNNGGDTGPYTRGTSFPIPENVKFIRSASYWKSQGMGTVWFDNGWNFFDKDWKNAGSCSWTAINFKQGAAAFSGDPVNSAEMKGRACQLIDIYPDKLKAAGVRYAVWNVLCYSHIAFSKAEDVFAALQWGEEPMAGGLFEPSRAQLSFPLTGEQMTKYVCVIDLERCEMIYLDANLKGDTHSASRNGGELAKLMPAFMEYIEALPSVHDLFATSVDKGAGESYILYSDEGTELQDVPAYVFRPTRQENKYTVVDINKYL